MGTENKEPKKRGAPAKDVKASEWVKFRATSEFKAVLSLLAAELGCSESEAIRQAVTMMAKAECNK